MPVLVLAGGAFREIAAGSPFAPEDGRQAHVCVAFAPPAVDGERLAALRAPGETLVAGRRAAYLHAPEGIGRSKLAARLEEVAGGCALTGRNLNTVRRLLGMLDEADAEG